MSIPNDDSLELGLLLEDFPLDLELLPSGEELGYDLFLRGGLDAAIIRRQCHCDRRNLRDIGGRRGHSRRYGVDLEGGDAGGDYNSSLRLEEGGIGHCHGSGDSSGGGNTVVAGGGVAGHQPDKLGMGEDLLLGAADGLGGDAGEAPTEQFPHEGRELGPFEEQRQYLLAEERLVEDDDGLAIVAPRGGALVGELLAALGGGIVHHQAEDVGEAPIGLIVARVIFG